MYDKLERRKHGCDGCHKKTSTERFNGYMRSVLWICGSCYKRMSAGIKRKHDK